MQIFSVRCSFISLNTSPANTSCIKSPIDFHKNILMCKTMSTCKYCEITLSISDKYQGKGEIHVVCLFLISNKSSKVQKGKKILPHLKNRHHLQSHYLDMNMHVPPHPSYPSLRKIFTGCFVEFTQ